MLLSREQLKQILHGGRRATRGGGAKSMLVYVIIYVALVTVFHARFSDIDFDEMSGFPVSSEVQKLAAKAVWRNWESNVSSMPTSCDAGYVARFAGAATSVQEQQCLQASKMMICTLAAAVITLALGPLKLTMQTLVSAAARGRGDPTSALEGMGEHPKAIVEEAQDDVVDVDVDVESQMTEIGKLTEEIARLTKNVEESMNRLDVINRSPDDLSPLSHESYQLIVAIHNSSDAPKLKMEGGIKRTIKYRHPKKGQRSRTMKGRKDFTTKKGHKFYNRQGHRQTRNAKGRRGQPYRK